MSDWIVYAAWAAVIAYVAYFVWLAYLIMTAREGWQDEKGFHYGPKPTNDERKD